MCGYQCVFTASVSLMASCVNVCWWIEMAQKCLQQHSMPTGLSILGRSGGYKWRMGAPVHTVCRAVWLIHPQDHDNLPASLQVAQMVVGMRGGADRSGMAVPTDITDPASVMVRWLNGSGGVLGCRDNRCGCYNAHHRFCIN